MKKTNRTSGFIIGSQFYYWTLKGKISDGGTTFWEVECKCGKNELHHSTNITRGRTPACAKCIPTLPTSMQPLISRYRAGQKIFDWTLIEQKQSKTGTWRARCECGVERIVHPSNLKKQNMQHCAQCIYKKKRMEQLTIIPEKRDRIPKNLRKIIYKQGDEILNWRVLKNTMSGNASKVYAECINCKKIISVFPKEFPPAHTCGSVYNPPKQMRFFTMKKLGIYLLSIPSVILYLFGMAILFKFLMRLV